MFNWWSWWFDPPPEIRCPLCSEIVGEDTADLWVKTETGIDKLQICQECAQKLDEQKSLGQYNLKHDPLSSGDKI